jgi:hypothetical protein
VELLPVVDVSVTGPKGVGKAQWLLSGFGDLELLVLESDHRSTGHYLLGCGTLQAWIFGFTPK